MNDKRILKVSDFIMFFMILSSCFFLDEIKSTFYTEKKKLMRIWKKKQREVFYKVLRRRIGTKKNVRF